MVAAITFMGMGIIFYWWSFIGDYYANLYTADFR